MNDSPLWFILRISSLFFMQLQQYPWDWKSFPVWVYFNMFDYKVTWNKNQQQNSYIRTKLRITDRKVCISLCSYKIVFILFFEWTLIGNDSNKINASGVLQLLSVRSGQIVLKVTPLFRLPGPGRDDITRTVFCLQVRLADILAQHAQADQLDPAEQADNADR